MQRNLGSYFLNIPYSNKCEARITAYWHRRTDHAPWLLKDESLMRDWGRGGFYNKKPV